MLQNVRWCVTLHQAVVANGMFSYDNLASVVGVAQLDAARNYRWSHKVAPEWRSRVRSTEACIHVPQVSLYRCR